MRRTSIPTLFIAFALAAAPAFAQSARVTGSLELEDGGDVQSVTVRLVPTGDSGTEKTGEPSKKGKFTIYPVMEGTYEIRFEPAEYVLSYIKMTPRSPSGQVYGEVKEETLEPGDGLPAFQIIDLMRMKLELRAKKVEAAAAGGISIAQAKDDSPKLIELNDLFNARDFDGLVVRAREVLAENPELGGAQYLLAVGLWQSGDLASADTEMAAALALSPDQEGIHATYGDLLTKRGQALAAAGDEASNGVFARAVEVLDVHLAENPADTSARINRVIALDGQGLVEETIAALDDLIALDPNEVRPYLHKAELLTDSGRPEEALAVIDAMPVASPAAADALYNVAVEIYDSGRNEETVAAIEKAIAAKPDEPLFYRLKGRALLAIGGRDAEGVDALRKYLSMVPDDDPAAEPDRALVEALGGG